MSEHIYKTIEVVGVSPKSEEDAIRNAIETVTKTVRHVGWFEVTESRGVVIDNKVAKFQVALKVGFRLEH